MAEILFITGAVKGLEKSAWQPFILPAGSRIKIEAGEDELDVTVPEGKVWHGKVGVFVREDDA